MARNTRRVTEVQGEDIPSVPEEEVALYDELAFDDHDAFVLHEASLRGYSYTSEEAWSFLNGEVLS